MYAACPPPSPNHPTLARTAVLKLFSSHNPPSAPGSVIRPRFIEDERTYGARTVHTVVLFTAPGGWGAATALRLQLEASAAKMFDIATFGSVYVRAVSGAYLVSAT